MKCHLGHKTVTGHPTGNRRQGQREGNKESGKGGQQGSNHSTAQALNFWQQQFICLAPRDAQLKGQNSSAIQGKLSLKINIYKRD